ncbi:transport related membrane protein [Pararhodospirillum oryzae]|uniref:Transport related membrane protein n=1 Tax=Pararhodospirillum oryzae TaxID=478448 RepID=A0A512H5F8_9PROT|nr:transport related membrane protein [Pararhodospirillum oryzae]
MQDSLPLSAIVAGFIAVIVSFAGPSVLIFQAASAAGLGPDALSSWIWAIAVGSGVSAIWLSWRTRAPVITAWSTPGAAFLVTALPLVPWPEAIGAFVVAAGLLTLLGLSGLFEAVTARLPQSIAAALLAGILFRFGVQVFTELPHEPGLVGAMIATYLVLRRLAPRYAIAGVLAVGTLIAGLSGELAFQGVSIELARPVWVTPVFSWEAIVSLGLPLALITLTGQFVPGVAVLRAFGYQTPSGPLVWGPSALAVPLACFGSHGINLAAITAAICTGPDAHPNPAKRWIAGVALGVFYLVIGAFGATLAAVFAALPAPLVATTAGLALLGAIQGGLAGAMKNDSEREPALLTFLVTASGMSFLGLGAAFWGLVLGLGAYAFLHLRFKKKGHLTP